MRRIIRFIALVLGAVIKHDSSPKVVFYHDIGDEYVKTGTPRLRFWAHMRHIRPSDVVCFDDGFRGVWDSRHEFKKRGIRPVIFVANRLVGGEGYLNWDEIRTLQDNYGFVFQSHTWSHQTLTGEMMTSSPVEERSEEWYRRELLLSRTNLESNIHRPVDELCFPRGIYSDVVLNMCKKFGFKKVYASHPGKQVDRFVVNRCLCQDLSEAEFLLTLHGGMDILAEHYKKLQKV